MAGQLKRLDTLDCGRKRDHERSDEGPQGVETAPGSSSPERRMECTTRRHVGSREISVSVKTCTRDAADSNASLYRKVARRVLYCGKLSHLVENATMRVIEQNKDVPMPQILVLQSEFIFL